MIRKVRICGVQIAVEPLAVDANLEKVVQWTERAREEFSPDLVVFPETITTTFDPGISGRELRKRDRR